MQKGGDYERGFTLFELLVVIVILGTLAAIAAPGWLRFLARQQTTSAQEHIRQDIQQAQMKSQQNNVLWQFSVRENNGIVETTTHPATVEPSESNWESLNKSIRLDSETTLLSKDGVRYVRFDEKGNVRGSRLGRVTVSSKQFSDIKHCVIVSTLIGATRTAQENPKPDPSYKTKDRFCY